MTYAFFALLLPFLSFSPPSFPPSLPPFTYIDQLQIHRRLDHVKILRDPHGSTVFPSYISVERILFPPHALPAFGPQLLGNFFGNLFLKKEKEGRRRSVV